MNVHAPTRSNTPSHEQRLDRLAEVTVKVGLGLKHGQEVVITAPLDALPLVRRVTEKAYKAGASLVTTLLGDEESTLLRFKYAADDAFFGYVTTPEKEMQNPSSR